MNTVIMYKCLKYILLSVTRITVNITHSNTKYLKTAFILFQKPMRLGTGLIRK
jgi:hypothetical protein